MGNLLKEQERPEVDIVLARYLLLLSETLGMSQNDNFAMYSTYYQ
jgi:hypothetical protein